MLRKLDCWEIGDIARSGYIVFERENARCRRCAAALERLILLCGCTITLCEDRGARQHRHTTEVRVGIRMTTEVNVSIRNTPEVRSAICMMPKVRICNRMTIEVNVSIRRTTVQSTKAQPEEDHGKESDIDH